MVYRGRRVILAAEVTTEDGRNLVRSLLPLDVHVYLATSMEQVFSWLRYRVFREAVIASELFYADEPVLTRLSRLPAMRSLIAVGPAGDMEAEAQARIAGATAYLGRPVTTQQLANILRIPIPRKTNHRGIGLQ